MGDHFISARYRFVSHDPRGLPGCRGKAKYAHSLRAAWTIDANPLAVAVSLFPGGTPRPRAEPETDHRSVSGMASRKQTTFTPLVTGPASARCPDSTARNPAIRPSRKRWVDATQTSRSSAHLLA